ncbi:T9SS type A sorting domain-containing protein [Flavihumibacter rivuli]|uniref:T9SS type A sorting domain-containing protein n=1 Tax=Flavihumibacter rivuli TaxID=2838156 RepID=UPI001BDED42A|nr:T9SS type A sorting domain-containing protein [Flavihumibacter rivuli]ULQ54984.1 T9SS type A sorting domain-containing protein [Flavihumibacter rivuli]
MKQRFLSLAGIVVVLGCAFLLIKQGDSPRTRLIKVYIGEEDDETEEEKEARKAMFVKERALYEYDMIRDGATGEVPKGIFERELQQASRIPVKEASPSGRLEPLINNTYRPAGPLNIGGRTRAVAYDKRFGTGTNRVIIAGAVSGGLFRSIDGGGNWTRVTPNGEIHNVTALAQDPRAGFENTWYAGGGEPIGNSASPSAGGAFYYGYGLMKSTDNGATWQRIASTFNGALELFDDPFDIVHKIAVHPVTGHVYVAGHRRLLRSTDGGNTFNVVFVGATPATADQGQMDITISQGGRIYLAVNGGFPDKAQRGLWFSDNGGTGTWTRFAGGQTAGVDSLEGWRANSYEANGNISQASKRIILSLAPSNNNILYVLYENGLSQEGTDGKPEADLFKIDFGASTYTNLSANMPDFTGQLDGIDPLALQGGYNLTLAVKPDNPNVVFVGGTNLFRSTDGFSSKNNTSWIAGYKFWGNGSPTVSTYDNTHPDIHNLIFEPNNPNVAICASDGGLHRTTNILANNSQTLPVDWTMIANYQTTQYYHVNIDPRAGRNHFIGGMQDNSSYLRTDGLDDHIRVGSGDGGAAAIGKWNGFSDYQLFVTSQFGSLARLTPGNAVSIRPNGLTANPSSGFGEFVTYFVMDQDNPEDLYYANFGRLFRTNSATTVSPANGWTELTGVASTISPSNPNSTGIGIRALELSRGPYIPSHVLYIGTTEGRVYRLNDPRNSAPTVTPIDITPPEIANIIGSGTSNPTRLNVSDIAVNPNNDEEIMVVYSNYQVTLGSGQVRRDFNIWFTKNAKSASPTWHKVENNLELPSIRSCAIVPRKDGAGNASVEYYVGTSVGLFSTENIGDKVGTSTPISWSREGSSVLNFAVVTSLAYRPQDNTLVIGTHGNGMYFCTIPQANFTPNLNTGVNDPIRNDKNFIQFAYPGIVTTDLNYRIGNMFDVQRLVIKVHNINGQLVYRKETGYQNGMINVGNLAKGTYVLTITSSDYKHQFVKQFIKN